MGHTHTHTQTHTYTHTNTHTYTQTRTHAHAHAHTHTHTHTHTHAHTHPATADHPSADLTPEMLADGSWKTTKFKQFNLNALGTPADYAALHPLMKVRTEYRQIFLEMGFEEMPTSRFVER